MILIAFIALRSAWVQNYITDFALKQLSEKYKAEWKIDKLQINFFDELAAEGILFLDTKKDTLLAAKSLKVDVGLFSLFSKKVIIDEINIDGVISHIYTLDNDSIYNFDFLTNLLWNLTSF